MKAMFVNENINNILKPKSKLDVLLALSDKIEGNNDIKYSDIFRHNIRPDDTKDILKKIDHKHIWHPSSPHSFFNNFAEKNLDKFFEPKINILFLNKVFKKACQLDYMGIIEWALDNDVNPDLKDNLKNTPLYHACKYMNFDVVKKLLKLGANPNSKNKNGITPLMSSFNYHMAVNLDRNVIWELLNNGGNLKLKSDLGLSSFDTAISSKKTMSLAYDILAKYKDKTLITDTGLKYLLENGSDKIILLALELGISLDKLIEKFNILPTWMRKSVLNKKLLLIKFIKTQKQTAKTQKQIQKLVNIS